MKEKILITGAAGMMGSHLVETLRNQGYLVIATYYNSTIDSRDPILLEMDEELNLLDYDAVHKCIQYHKPTLIYHLAAQSRPDVSFKDPSLTICTNVLGTLNLLKACSELENKPKIINASSSAVYGDIDWSIAPDELVTPKPLSPYGTSKLAQEHLMRNYYDMYSIKYVNVRIFNCTGPRKVNDLVSDLCQRVVKGEYPIKVGNVSGIRSIIDVRDLVEGLVLCSKLENETINLGSPYTNNVSDIVEMIIKGSDTESDQSLFRPTDEKIIYGNINKAFNLLNWSPKISLQQTIEDTIQYWKSLN